MWPFNSLASIGGMKKNKALFRRRSRARCRALRVELMERRVPLSASALMLTDDTTEALEDAGALAAEEAMIAPDSGDQVTLDVLDADPEMFCEPVASSEVEGAEASLDGQQSDFQAIEAVMEMGPMVWQPPETTVDDSGELLAPASLDDPAVSESEDLTSEDLTSEDLTSVALITSGPSIGDPGAIDVITLDPIAVDTPEIVDFFASSSSYDIWFFEGRVVYDQPQTLTIVFGGLLEGHTTHVTMEGIFNYALQMPPGSTGLVTVKALTPNGIESNMMSWVIF